MKRIAILFGNNQFLTAFENAKDAMASVFLTYHHTDWKPEWEQPTPPKYVCTTPAPDGVNYTVVWHNLLAEASPL